MSLLVHHMQIVKAKERAGSDVRAVKSVMLLSFCLSKFCVRRLEELLGPVLFNCIHKITKDLFVKYAVCDIKEDLLTKM